MAVEVIVPELGENVVTATVSRWHFKEGDRVMEGDEIVELITEDKRIVTVPAPVSGILLEILVEEEDIVEVGEALATIDEMVF